ncbi:hypothetical protein CWS02_14095 [Enterobacter sp. EA-1]|nr:hypothetical protein CWS02_14095 [Enterobacter sp. EA-1]
MTALLPAIPARQHPVAHFRHNIDALLLRLNDEFEKTKDVQGDVAAFNERGFLVAGRALSRRKMTPIWPL